MVNLCETQIVSALSELPHCVIYTCTVYERRRGGREKRRRGGGGGEEEEKRGGGGKVVIAQW